MFHFLCKHCAPPRLLQAILLGRHRPTTSFGACCRLGQQSVPHVSIPCAGIAPYRAFWRRFFLEDVPNYKFGGLAWLFMGVANSDAKLYDDELQMLVKEYPKQVHSSPSKGCGASVTLPSLPYDELQRSCEEGFQAGLPPDMFLCIWILHSWLMSGWHYAQGHLASWQAMCLPWASCQSTDQCMESLSNVCDDCSSA